LFIMSDPRFSPLPRCGDSLEPVTESQWVITWTPPTASACRGDRVKLPGQFSCYSWGAGCSHLPPSLEHSVDEGGLSSTPGSSVRFIFVDCVKRTSGLDLTLGTRVLRRG
jgi:hypothetical protein